MEREVYRYSPEQDKFVPYATEALKRGVSSLLCAIMAMN